MTASKKTSATAKNPVSTANSKISVTVIFVDLIKKPISGLAVQIKSTSLTKETLTDEQGRAATIDDVVRGEEVRIYVKKRNGEFCLRHIAKPKNDINIYTIRSPELHLYSQTKLSAKEKIEEVVSIPSIAAGEVMTSARLFGELAPFVGVASTISEEGKVIKDFPTNKQIEIVDPKNGQKKQKKLIEHHYKIIKTQKPVQTTLSILGGRL